VNLNPYVLSGQIINGIGIELNPRKFRFSAVQGRMENPLAQIDTLIKGAEVLQTFDRSALGIKIGYGTNRNLFELSMLKVKDRTEGVDQSLINDRFIKPEENLVIGTNLNLSPMRWLSLSANLAASGHTANQNSSDILSTEELMKAQEDYGNILTLNLSSKLQLAGDASVDIKFKNFQTGIQYKRVDPFYRSLGTYYFLEDYENWLVRLNFSTLKGKVRFSGRGGLQRNNLNNLRSVTNSRRIASMSLIVKASSKLTSTFRYSNFQTDRSPGLIEVNDTLRYARATNIIGVQPRYSFGNSNKKSTISLSMNYQKLDDLLNNQETDRTINNYTANLNYTIRFIPRSLTTSVGLTANQNSIADRETLRMGINLRAAKKLLDKQANVSSNIGYFQNFLNQERDGSSISARLNFSYKMDSKLRTSFHFNYLNRNGNVISYSELRGTMKVIYLFPEL